MMRSAIATLLRARAGALQSSAPGLSALGASAAGISTSASVHGPAAVAVEGNVDAFLSDVDAVIGSDACSAKDVADAALALTYLQAKGNRRAWGKLLEKAASLKASFDPATLSSFLWAVATSNVTHFKTIYELAGPAHAQLASFNAQQLSFVVEALGKAGVSDVELFKAVSARVTAKPADFKPSDLARILWGAAAAGQADVKLVKAAGKALSDKADAASGRDLAQVVWAHAAMGRSDKAVVDAAVKGLKGKLEGAADAAAVVWALAALNAKPDAELLAKAAAALKEGAAELSTAQQVHTAWGMALLGANDKDVLGGLLTSIAGAITKDAGALSIADSALLSQAAAMLAAKGGPKLPDAVAAFADHCAGLVKEHAALRRPKLFADFRADVANCAAYALGARYKPDIAKAVAGFAKADADLAADVDGTKVAIECLEPSALSANAPHVPLGGAAAQARVLEARGYKVVNVLYPEWAALSDRKAKANYLLSAIKTAAPSAASKAGALAKDLDKPFDAYAD